MDNGESCTIIWNPYENYPPKHVNLFKKTLSVSYESLKMYRITNDQIKCNFNLEGKPIKICTKNLLSNTDNDILNKGGLPADPSDPINFDYEICCGIFILTHTGKVYFYQNVDSVLDWDAI